MSEHLKQLGLAWFTYVGDHQDRLAPNNPQNPDDRDKNWVRGRLGGSGTPDNTNVLKLTDSLVGSYIGNAVGVFRCPGDKSVSRHGSQIYPRVRSVSMKTWLNNRQKNSGSDSFDNDSLTQFQNHRINRRISDLVDPSPSGPCVFIDEREDTIADGAVIMGMEGIRPAVPTKWGWASWPAYSHNRSSSISFADDHAFTHRWLDRRTTPHRATIYSGNLQALLLQKTR